MSNLFLVLIIAFVVIVLAIAALAIGWLVTGRTKVDSTLSSQDSLPFDSETQTDCNLYSSSLRSSKSDQNPPSLSL